MNALLSGAGCSSSPDQAPDPHQDNSGYTNFYKCKAIPMAYCPGGKGCAQSSEPYSQPFDKATTIEALDSTIKASKDYLQKYHDRAQTCCSSGSGCDVSSAKADYTKLLDTVALSKTSGTVCSAIQDEATNRGRQRNTGLSAGLCEGMRGICYRRAEATKQLLAKAPCQTDECKASASSAAPTFAQICDDLSSSTIASQSQSFGDAANASNDTAKQAAGQDGVSDPASCGVTAGGSDPGSTLKAQSKDPSDPGPTAPGSTSPGGNTSPGGATTTNEGGGSGMGAGLGTMLQSMLPMAMAMLQQQQQPQPADMAPQPAPVDCSNPATFGCSVAKANTSWNTASTNGSASATSPNSTGGFNLGDTSGIQPASIGAGPSVQGPQVTTQGVANGGGGFPGGGSSGGAMLGGGTGNGAVGAGMQPSSKADILHGEGGHSGYSQVAAGMNMSAGGSSGGYTYGGGGGGSGDGAVNGLRLADFLPGGKKDPARGIASVAAPMQIQSKSVNIWSRISEHIRTRCAQGLLRDCNP